MRLPNPPSRRLRRALAVLAGSALIALALAVWSVSSVSLSPPGLHPRELPTAAATTHVLIDMPRSEITNRTRAWDYFAPLSMRADLLARVASSAPAVDRIAKRAGIPADDIAAVSPVTASVQSALTEPGSEQRARELLLASKRYRLEIMNRPQMPLLDIYAQAPSAAEAERLAGAAVIGLRDELRAQARAKGLDPRRQVRLEQLGNARGAVINPGVELKLAVLTFFIAFCLSCAALFVLVAALSRRRHGASAPAADPAADVAGGAVAVTAATAAPPVRVRWPQPAGAGAGGALALPTSVPRLRMAIDSFATHGGDWPRTTRALPWMLAIFMAILWLVPFDSIQLAISLPIDLKFDRLVLPFIFVTWVLALCAGGPDAPRLRMTSIHLAVAAFVAVAALSVVLDAIDLNQSLELDTSLKKLPLLIAYLSIFVMTASVVRRTEVQAFFKYTLGLAVICALGMIWEYRVGNNLFFDWSGKLLPGVFQIADGATGYDLGGRRVTHGPAAHGLVAVTMLAMAMPIAVVGLIQAKRWSTRFLYGAAVGVIMIAVLATQRKTGIIAPVAGVATLAYFRRRELLKLAPLGIALLAVLVIVSPGTVQPVIDQFQPDRLGANTVSDRASDYDAVRPDVWTHLAFGRGYGSYQPLGHRILDSEVLVRIVEMGVIGLVTFLLLGISVLVSARATIASRHPAWAPPALAGAAAAVVFLVVALLFDTMSFPQSPYIFLCLAALVAAVLPPPGEEEPGAPPG
jgi:hypothetical protein